jgi:hypothetical protein
VSVVPLIEHGEDVCACQFRCAGGPSRDPTRKKFCQVIGQCCSGAVGLEQQVPGRRRWSLSRVVALVGAWRRACRALRPGAASVSESTAPTEILEQVGHPLSNRPDHVVILHLSAPKRRRRCRHRPLYHFRSVPARRSWSNREFGYPATRLPWICSTSWSTRRANARSSVSARRGLLTDQ